MTEWSFSRGNISGGYVPFPTITTRGGMPNFGGVPVGPDVGGNLSRYLKLFSRGISFEVL